MRNYYAFNYRRYEHALHPSTIGVIIETGFLTSARDRRVIVNDPERAARGIVDAVVAFPVTPPAGRWWALISVSTRWNFDSHLSGLRPHGSKPPPSLTVALHPI
jgi:hypothetical protein